MASRDPERPNVVVVISDDQGPWALRCAGNPEIVTPHLDQLAASGVRLSNLYCASPVCSPARASVLTGLTPSQHGVHDWIREGNAPPDAIAYLDRLPTYTQALSDSGYTCGLSGKWHLGDSSRPQAAFEHWFAHAGSHSDYVGAPMFRDGELVHEPGYITDRITDDALSFVQQASHDEAPFYLSVHYTAPHHPWVGQHPRRYLELYQDCAFESCPQEPAHPWLHDRMAGAVAEAVRDPRPSLIGYFAAVTAMDAAIKRLVDGLAERDLAGSTVLLFLSDNGFACGQHGIWGKGNGTYPQNMYEESVRVPAIIAQPGRVPAGIVVDDLMSAYDVYPTILDLAGLTPSDTIPMPGRSWLDLVLRGRPARERVVVFDEYGPTRMIRTHRWKLVTRHPAGPDELYDLSVDPGERENRVDEPSCRVTVRDLHTQLTEWFARYSRPETAGWELPVTGRGQLAKVDGPQRRQAFS